MTRRPGMTMTEVLVAIFVVAIGLAGVMSMVPFGAKQMSDALVADRATSHATTIDGMVRSYWKEKIVEDLKQDNSPAPTPPEAYIDREPFFVALDTPGRSLPPPGATEASYPVFLDPMGVVGRAGRADQLWVGDGGGTNVPRRTMNGVQFLAPYAPYLSPNGNPGPPPGMNVVNTRDSSTALRMWSQADGFSWNEDSVPEKDLTTKTTTQREYRYNALAVIQRPTNSARYTATFKVVVFSNRRHMFYPTNGPEPVFSNVALTPTSTEIKLPATADVQKGGWIMDATVTSVAPFIRHANFYRVVSAVDNGSVVNGVPHLDIELHTPITRVDGRNTTGDAYTGTVVVLPGVAGVFERPALTAGAP